MHGVVYIYIHIHRSRHMIRNILCILNVTCNMYISCAYQKNKGNTFLRHSLQLVDICYTYYNYIYNMVQRRGVVQKIGPSQATGSVGQWVSSHHVFCHLHSGYQIQHFHDI